MSSFVLALMGLCIGWIYRDLLEVKDRIDKIEDKIREGKRNENN